MPSDRETPSVDGRAGLREMAIVSASLLVLTAALTYPQITQFGTHVGIHYDALFSIWRLSWIAHQLPRAPLQLFDANIFYPTENTLALSDAILLPALLTTPMIWLGVSPVIAYNALIWLSFVTAGTSAYWLALSLGASRSGAAFAAVAFAFHPYRFAHYPQLELLWTCWIPLAFWALHRAATTGKHRYGLWLGLFVTLQALSCLYYAVFLVTALAILAAVHLLFPGGTQRTQLVKIAATGAAVALPLLALYAMPYLRNASDVGTRDYQEVQRWSATLTSYVTPQIANVLYGSPPQEIDPYEKVLFPGLMYVAMAAVAIVFVRRQTVFAYALLTIVAVDLSLGFNGFTYPLLFEAVPFYKGLRVPARFFAIVAAALAVLASFGVTHLVALFRSAIPAVLAIAVIIVESASVPLLLERVPDVPSTYRWLSGQEAAPVFEWPAPAPEDIGVTFDPEYMYFSTRHWHPLVNGYSGKYPLSYVQFLEGVRSFPSDEAVRFLQKAGVRHIIVHSRGREDRFDSVMNELVASPRLTLQFHERFQSDRLAAFFIQPQEP